MPIGQAMRALFLELERSSRGQGLPPSRPPLVFACCSNLRCERGTGRWAFSTRSPKLLREAVLVSVLAPSLQRPAR